MGRYYAEVNCRNWTST